MLPLWLEAADAIRSPETARIYRPGRRRGGRVAAYCARAAAGDAGGRVSHQQVEPSRRTSFWLLRNRSRVIELPARRGLREDETRWRFGLPGACEHW